jgi:hypothetical protein
VTPFQLRPCRLPLPRHPRLKRAVLRPHIARPVRGLPLRHVGPRHDPGRLALAPGPPTAISPLRDSRLRGAPRARPAQLRPAAAPGFFPLRPPLPSLHLLLLGMARLRALGTQSPRRHSRVGGLLGPRDAAGRLCHILPPLLPTDGLVRAEPLLPFLAVLVPERTFPAPIAHPSRLAALRLVASVPLPPIGGVP